MPITYTMSATCDKCGVMIEPPVNVKKGELDRHRWKWLDKWAKEGVMRGLQPKYGQAKLYCAKCAG